MEAVCSSCSVVLSKDARFCSRCGAPRPLVQRSSEPSTEETPRRQTPQPPTNTTLGSALSSIPVLNWPAKAIRALSGIPELTDSLKADPLNPFVHFRIAERFDKLDELRGGYRFVRALVTHGVSELSRFATRQLVTAVDGKQDDPRIGFYRNAAHLALAHLRAQPLNDSLVLVLGASSGNLALHLDSIQWLRRAERAFLLILTRSRNRFILADAAFGLAILYSHKTPKHSTELAKKYFELLADLTTASSLEDWERTCPSIWHVNNSSPSHRIGAPS